jgi:predicted ATP-grasp superfamily ATP-dependent carboligase
MTDQNKGKVLVFGDDMRIFLAVVRSLGRAGIEVHAAPLNRDYPALKSKYISAIHHFPSYSMDPNGWLNAVLSTLHTHAFDLVIPCCDPAILPLHIHRQDFGDQRLAIPSPASMDLLFDKELTRQLCTETSINIVKGARLGKNQDAKQLVAEFGLPLVIKPRRSYWDDALEAWGKVSIPETEQNVHDVLASIRDRSRYLVESYFEGAGTGVSVLAKDGKILQAFQHRRLREGRGGNSSFRISEAVHDELLKACEKISARMNLNGVCMFEFRYNDNTNDWILIETNARFWGSLPLPVAIGVNFPKFLYDLMVHQVQHERVFYPIGIKSRNLMLDGFNLLRQTREGGHGQSNHLVADILNYITQPLRWLIGTEHSDSFVSDDLKPAFWEFFSLLRSLRERRQRLQNEKPAAQ